MGKHYLKLIASVSLLLVAVTMVAVTSYAWMVLSTSPVAQGMEIAIAGGNTILVAPDITATVDGVTYHYPGRFDDKLNFAQDPNYAFLSQLGGLNPVSTADGLSWFIPQYYSSEDPDSDPMKNGLLREYGDFLEDKTLSYANLTADQTEQLKEGSFVYLDFWVVSPGEAYDLRVASGSGSDGSFATSLPSVTEEGGILSLGSGVGQAAACVRVGFLVNSAQVLDSNAMQLYSRSPAYREQYKQLMGVYQEPGYSIPGGPETKFTIYEPNGDLHPDPEAAGVADGDYVHTQPIGPGGVQTDVQDSLFVQLDSHWIADANGRLLEQAFHTAITGKMLSADKAEKYFYESYLQYQVGHYINQGVFVTRTADLYAYVNTAQNGVVPRQTLEALALSGATEDVTITTLQRQTPQRIRMYIWLEGQDVDCVNSAADDRLVINIQLAGGSTTQ